jgi:hypothetical protein
LDFVRWVVPIKARGRYTLCSAIHRAEGVRRVRNGDFWKSELFAKDALLLRSGSKVRTARTSITAMVVVGALPRTWRSAGGRGSPAARRKWLPKWCRREPRREASGPGLGPQGCRAGCSSKTFLLSAAAADGHRFREEQRELQGAKPKSRGTEIVPPPKLKFGPKTSKAEVWTLFVEQFAEDSIVVEHHAFYLDAKWLCAALATCTVGANALSGPWLWGFSELDHRTWDKPGGGWKV